MLLEKKAERPVVKPRAKPTASFSNGRFYLWDHLRIKWVQSIRSIDGNLGNTLVNFIQKALKIHAVILLDLMIQLFLLTIDGLQV